MTLQWRDLGHIFNLGSTTLPADCLGFSQSPQALVLDDRIRIFFSARQAEQPGMFVSQVLYVDFDKQLNKVLGICEQPVIELGELGCFDEHGIFPLSPLRVGNEIYAYTCGWSRRQSVSVETSVGLAISQDQGKSFQRVGLGPILSSSLNEPFLVGDAFVQYFKNQFHMWYMFGTQWLTNEQSEVAERVYKIGHATSDDGINWQKEEGVQIVPDILGPEESMALPSVIEIDSQYHMVFCYRHSTDFRTNPERGYRLGYAVSKDLLNWERCDERLGLEFSASGWNGEMQCYPHWFHCDGNVFLLYNGNEFGRHGFGAFQLVD